MAILDVPHGEAVTRELLRREVIVDHRPGAGIRISPHFYTTDDEVRRVVQEIREILDSGSLACARHRRRHGVLTRDRGSQPHRGCRACGSASTPRPPAGRSSPEA